MKFQIQIVMHREKLHWRGKIAAGLFGLATRASLEKNLDYLHTDTKLQPENKVNVFELIHMKGMVPWCVIAQYFQEGQTPKEWDKF